MGFRLLIASLTFILSTTANSEDVIYQKDGSALKGTLTEQDFQNGRYKIQLPGGSIFSIKESDILKITREAETIQSIESNKVVQESTSTTSTNNIYTQVPAMHIPIGTYAKTIENKSVVYIGTMSKSYSDIYDDSGKSYRGFNIAYQANVSRYIAIYTALNFGDLSTITINGNEYESGNSNDEKYRSFEIDALLSTNHNPGWQFYSGVGLFKEKYSSNYYDQSFSGANFIFGMGYSWDIVQTQLRIAVNNSSDYHDDDSHISANLQLGYNFK